MELWPYTALRRIMGPILAASYLTSYSIGWAHSRQCEEQHPLHSQTPVLQGDTHFSNLRSGKKNSIAYHSLTQYVPLNYPFGYTMYRKGDQLTHYSMTTR